MFPSGLYAVRAVSQKGLMRCVSIQYVSGEGDGKRKQILTLQIVRSARGIAGLASCRTAVEMPYVIVRAWSR